MSFFEEELLDRPQITTKADKWTTTQYSLEKHRIPFLQKRSGVYLPE